MAIREDVTPNRRGTRSRETVLDAAERVMATQGYDGATVGAIVKDSGIPMSSVYHYFGSKDGVLLAVMERGAQRFFDAVPAPTERVGSPREHIALTLSAVETALGEHPDFLRLVIVMATQPPAEAVREAHTVVTRVRETALRRMREQLALAFDLDAHGAATDRLARFAIATIDGSFVAAQADASVTIGSLFEHLPDALIAVHQALPEPGR